MSSHGIFCLCPRCLTGTTSKKGKNRGHRNGKSTQPTRRPSKGFDGRKSHDTKGKNRHGRTRW